MNERERLVEILDKAPKSLRYEDLPDYLLENNVVVLPCKIGDIVYVIPKYKGKPYCGVVSDKIQMIGITSRGWHIKTKGTSNFNKTYMLGKTAFLTKEEAEHALKGGK